MPSNYLIVVVLDGDLTIQDEIITIAAIKKIPHVVGVKSVEETFREAIQGIDKPARRSEQR